MASRIFWILLAGAALVIGMVVQDDDAMFSWGRHGDASARIERKIDERIDRAVDRSVARIQVVDARGAEIIVPAENKRALADAVVRLAEAEAGYAILRTRDGNRQELVAAKARRDHARAEVETLKQAIKAHEQASDPDQGRRELRDEIRATVREAVRN
jgi:regulator of protease activity HflC (stomatin/prohibitin superfamily)